ncbi:transposable element Tcb1 transposase [Trichonephila clavipes]|nr:transposable element Tcb1 transposase [Trichonephila clavipes]
MCLQHQDGRIRVWRHRGERMLNSCIMHRHTGSALGIMIWSGIGCHSHPPLVRIAGTLNRQSYISKITSPDVTPDQLWQRVEAAWSAVPQELIQNIFESMPSGNLQQCLLSWLPILAGNTLHRSL